MPENGAMCADGGDSGGSGLLSVGARTMFGAEQLEPRRGWNTPETFVTFSFEKAMTTRSGTRHVL